MLPSLVKQKLKNGPFCSVRGPDYHYVVALGEFDIDVEDDTDKILAKVSK